jgi:hypothetical protein
MRHHRGPQNMAFCPAKSSPAEALDCLQAVIRKTV